MYDLIDMEMHFRKSLPGADCFRDMATYEGERFVRFRAEWMIGGRTFRWQKTFHVYGIGLMSDSSRQAEVDAMIDEAKKAADIAERTQ